MEVDSDAKGRSMKANSDAKHFRPLNPVTSQAQAIDSC